MNLQFQVLEDFNQIPFDLLLLADPDIEKVKAYCKTEKTVIARFNDLVIGAYVLETSKYPDKAEILNIAVPVNYQNQGIGKFLLKDAINRAKSLNKNFIEVATGNSSIGQLAFYQKAGFEMVEIVRNYFIDNYEMPIFENGIPCKHQVRFVLEL